MNYRTYALYSFNDGQGRETVAKYTVRTHLQLTHPELDEVPPENADLIIAFGGDGTLLGALRTYSAPILSLNTGTKGFLTAVREPELFITAVDAALGGKFLEMRVVTMLMTHRLGDHVNECNVVDEVLLCSEMTWMTVRIETVHLETGATTFIRDMRCAGMYIGAPLGATSPMGVDFQCPVMDPELRAFYLKGRNDPLKPTGGYLLSGQDKRLHLTITDIGVNPNKPAHLRYPPNVYYDAIHAATLAVGDTIDIAYLPSRTLLRPPDQSHWSRVFPG